MREEQVSGPDSAKPNRQMIMQIEILLGLFLQICAALNLFVDAC